MKRLLAAIFAATMLAATPALAGGGHGHGHHGDKHFWKEQKRAEKEWRKAHKHAWKHERRHVVVHREPVFVERHVHHYVEQRPVVYAPPAYVAAPASLNIHIPLR